MAELALGNSKICPSRTQSYMTSHAILLIYVGKSSLSSNLFNFLSEEKWCNYQLSVTIEDSILRISEEIIYKIVTELIHLLEGHGHGK